MPGHEEQAAEAFYDDLAEAYHLIFEDWDRSLAWQAGILGPLLARLGVPPHGRVLDCACGIGTQALGLAAQGYRVRGSDVSAGAVARLAREAAARGLHVAAAVRDVRALEPAVDGRHDAVLAFDNSLAHMHGDDDLDAALRAMASCTTPGGLVLASVRPYDALAAERPGTTHPRVSGERPHRRTTFQLWEWAEDGRTYRVDHVELREGPHGWTTTARAMRLRAVRRDDMLGAARRVGLRDVRWLEPAASGYYQPIVVGMAPS